MKAVEMQGGGEAAGTRCDYERASAISEMWNIERFPAYPSYQLADLERPISCQVTDLNVQPSMF